MIEDVRENLLGYVLDALEDDERADIESQIHGDASLQEELKRLENMVRPVHAAQPRFAPPVGLLDRTCDLIDQHASNAPSLEGVARVAEESNTQTDGSPPSDGDWHETGVDPMAPVLGHAASPPRSRFTSIHGDSRPSGQEASTRWVDFAVLTGVVVLLVAMAFPALQSGRFQSRIVQCGDNLRQIGRQLEEYSVAHDDRFPAIPAEGRLAAAGLFAPLLKDSELLTDASLLTCPDSSQTRNGAPDVRSVAELQAMPPGPAFDKAIHEMGGDYAYTLGHMANGAYHPAMNQHRASFPIMSDSPVVFSEGPRSLSHGGLGQNVLYEDGRVNFVNSPNRPIESGSDNFFLNDSGVIAAGNHAQDAVLGASHQPPIRLVGNR